MAGIFGYCEACGAWTRIRQLWKSGKLLCRHCRRVKRSMEASFELKNEQGILRETIFDNTMKEHNNDARTYLC